MNGVDMWRGREGLVMCGYAAAADAGSEQISMLGKSAKGR